MAKNDSLDYVQGAYTKRGRKQGMMHLVRASGLLSKRIRVKNADGAVVAEGLFNRGDLRQRDQRCSREGFYVTQGETRIQIPLLSIRALEGRDITVSNFGRYNIRAKQLAGAAA